MHKIKLFDKQGNIRGYKLVFSGKDPLTGKHKNYSKVWNYPQGLTESQKSHALKKFEYEYGEYVRRVSAGLEIEENNILFSDFANNWLENILKRNKESYSYYVRAKQNLAVILPFFKDVMLKAISPTMVQKFYDYICSRPLIRQQVVVKKSINALIEEKKLSKAGIANELGINRLTVRLASQVGHPIQKKTAQLICNYLNVPLSKYFDVQEIETRYSKATNQSIRTTLVVILGEAKRQRIVDHNYATKEFTKNINGPTKEKSVYSEDEAKEFLQAVLQEKDLRKRTMFSLSLLLGLRRAEICGLCWDDINFNEKTLTVSRNTLYLTGFGIKTKTTKTKNSHRVLYLPETLINVLKEYKTWWDEQKNIHGDLWEFSDKEWNYSNWLFLQECGKPLNPHTVGQWLYKFQAKNGLKRISMHQIRHTSITLQLLAGIPLKVVSQNAGHANEEITLEIYTHSLSAQQKQAPNTFETFMLAN